MNTKATKKKTTRKKKVPGNKISTLQQPSREIAAPAAPTMTDQLLRLAVDKDLDMDKLERLLEMKNQEEEKTAKAAFNAAMAVVQRHIQPIISDAENDHTGSRYAKLCTVVNTLAPIYTEQGFSVSYGQAKCDSEKLINDGWFRTTAELSHAAGFSKDYFVDLPADIMGSGGKVNKTQIHGTKSTITYARGILMGMMFNFTTSDDGDTDGNMPGEVITEEQAANLRDHLSAFDDADECERDLCSFLKVPSLAELPVKLFAKAMKAINEQKAAEGIK